MKKEKLLFVKRSIKCCLSVDKEGYKACTICPYQHLNPCIDLLLDDALSAIKYLQNQNNLLKKELKNK